MTRWVGTTNDAVTLTRRTNSGFLIRELLLIHSQVKENCRYYFSAYRIRIRMVRIIGGLLDPHPHGGC